MSDFSFSLVEQGLRAARARSSVLAFDVATVGDRGEVARDLSPIIEDSPGGFRFALEMRRAPSGAGGIERAMAATAENSIRFRALASQEHAMLRELRTVAEDARR